MVVVCDGATKKLVENKRDCITTGALRKKWQDLGGVFAVVLPLPDEIEVDLANYIASRDVTAFILHRGVVGIEFIRLLFGEGITLRRARWPEEARSEIEALEGYLRRRVEYVIEPASPAGELPPETNRPFVPLATLGESTNVCAGAVVLRPGTAVLAPFGKSLDAKDVANLEKTADALFPVVAPYLDKVSLRVCFTEPEALDATLQIEGGRPERLGSQHAAILAALFGKERTSLREIGWAIDNIESLYEPPLEPPALSEEAVDNRIRKLNKRFRDVHGLDFDVVVTVGNRRKLRGLNPRVRLVVDGLPD